MNSENDMGGSGEGRQNELLRFDFLMKRHLEQQATDLEKKELRRLVDNGYGARFEEWIDEYGGANSIHLPPAKRQEILTNIIGDKSNGYRWWPNTVWLRWAAVLFIAMGGMMWFVLRGSKPNQIAMDQPKVSSSTNEMRVLKGKQFVILPDGSRVLMNANSILSYFPESFDGASREVKLSGEAFFDIVSNPDKPFLVKSGDVITRVLGTSFNVNMQQDKVVVTVTRGLVEVGKEDRVYAKIKPDQQITVHTENEQFNTISVHATKEIAWKDNYLVVDNTDLEMAGTMIGEHYGVQLIFTNKDVLKCRMTASFLNNEDLTTVLNVLSQVIGATYKREGNKIVIEGGGCE